LGVIKRMPNQIKKSRLMKSKITMAVTLVYFLGVIDVAEAHTVDDP